MPTNAGPKDAAPQADASGEMLEWVARFPIWRNKLVMRQLALVFVIPLLFLALLLMVILWPPVGEQLLMISKIVGITAGVFMALLVIAVALLSIGGYQMEYRMDERGIGGRTHGRTAKRNRVINVLLMLSGRPSAMGAGMLAHSRQEEYVAWKDVERAETDPRQRTVALYKGRRALMVVACDKAHYEAVLERARSAAARRQTRTKSARRVD